MEGLPIDITLDVFIGRKVTMVRIGQSFLHYILNDDKPNRPDAWIEIESDDLTFIDEQGRPTSINNFRTAGGLLCLPLGLTIENGSRRNDGGLLLEFSTGIRLEIAIHTSRYESVVLHTGDQAIVG
jgi:hypothetical protein